MSHSQPMQPGTAAGAAPLSAGTLFYLWADRLLEPSGMLGGHTLPSGVRVSSKQLAPLLFAISFARLQADGVVRLEPVTRKTLGMKKQHVQVTPAAQPGHRGGFEHAIVQRMMAGDDTAFDIVWKWLGQSTASPEGDIFTLARLEMLHTGLAHGDKPAKLVPLPDRITTTFQQFQQFQVGWESFQRNDPALAELLLETCGKAVRNARARDDF